MNLYRVSWDNEWNQYRYREFRGASEEGKARAFLKQQDANTQLRRVRLECNGVWLDGHRPVYAVARERDEDSAQLELGV